MEIEMTMGACTVATDAQDAKLQDKQEVARNCDPDPRDHVVPEGYDTGDYAHESQEPKSDHIELGKRGEEAAARYLVRNGYNIIERNWRCRFGEADIIAEDVTGSLVFVEVKTRRSLEAGIPEEAVTHAKRRRYERIAMCYMIEEDYEPDINFRFDAIGICVTGEHRAVLRHHQGIFDASF